MNPDQPIVFNRRPIIDELNALNNNLHAFYGILGAIIFINVLFILFMLYIYKKKFQLELKKININDSNLDELTAQLKESLEINREIVKKLIEMRQKRSRTAHPTPPLTTLEKKGNHATTNGIIK